MNFIGAIRSSFSKLRPQATRTFCINEIKMEGVKTIKDLGYTFNNNGEIRKLGGDGQLTDEPFQFNISSDQQECQAHYEELGTAVSYYIYNILETELNLLRLPIPKQSTEGTFIFVSNDYDQKDVLLVLLHGSGVVRAGQWSRAVIINENLEKGSQIPYIKKAIAKDYGIMILNSNDLCTPDGKTIPHCGTAEEHARYVWDTYISKTKASSIVIVAHSYGGLVILKLAKKVKKDFEKRVKAVAFTDSVHTFTNKKVNQFLKQVAQNWISSPSPLDTPMTTPDSDITRVSAGHQKHEMTSYTCMESVFKFFEEKLSAK